MSDSSPPDAPTTVGIQPPGSRLPDATRVGPVRLQISDLARSRSFYENVLGFRVLEREDDRTVVGTAGGNRPLVELVEDPSVQPVSPRTRLGLFHVAFRLPDRPTLGTFVQHVSEMGIEPGMADHLVSEALYLSDPDGLGIEVYADRAREDWRTDAEGQIEMATKPLDARALVAAAGDATWTGAPTGTVVGHVHLHVGDLDRAAAFYHEALGLDKVMWSYPGALFLSAGGYHHHLGTNVWAGDVPPAGEDDARLLEWTLVLPDADDVTEAAQRLDDAGYAVTRDAGTCRVTDPWGTVLRLAASD